MVGTPHSPADGKADFQYIGDAGISALILAYPSSRATAMSRAMVSMANQMIAAAQDIQVDDIRIKTIERARLMLESALSISGANDSAEADSAFSVVPLTTQLLDTRPQGTPYPVM
jgi:hypothetical protein